MQNLCYLCGDIKFFNIWQAFDHQKSTGIFPTFQLDPEFISSIQNIKRPNNVGHHYIKNLIVKRLKQLRSKFKYLRLALGGGTDSFSILKYCVEHDIYIDEVFCHLVTIDTQDIKNNIEYLPSLRYAEKHVGKSIGNVLKLHPTVQEYETMLQADWYKNPDIIRGNHMPGRWSIISQFYTQTQLPVSESITITGLEKPYVRKEDGKFYWTQIDAGISEIMGCENILPIFFDKENPELTVAMTYALLDKSDTNREFIAYEIQPKHKKLDILHHMGLESTGHHYLDFHMLGKSLYDFLNYKNKAARRELIRIGRKDIVDAYLKNMKLIILRYRNLPHAIEIKDNVHMKTVNRLSQKVPIYQDSFGA